MLARESRCSRELFHRGHEYPHVPDVWVNGWPGMDIERQGALRQRRRCPPCHASVTPPTAHRRRHRLRHRLRRRRQRMTPIGRAIEECRMQFPRPCVAPRIRIVGIATFVDTVEHSPNRTACATAPSERQQRARGHASPPPDRRAASPLAPARTWARHLARGPADPRLGPLIRTLTH